MGSSNSQVIKQKVENAVNNKISESTTNISNVVENTLNEFTTKIGQTAKTSININNGAGNSFNTSGGITASGGSTFILDQEATLKAQNQAIIKIVMDSSSLASAVNQIAADIQNKTKNDTSAAQAAQNLQNLGALSKQNGGPEGMLSSVTGMVEKVMASMTGGGSNSNQETEIINTVSSEINKQSYNESNITNNIKSVVNNTITQDAFGECGLNSSVQNAMNIGGAIELTNGANVELKQKALAEVLNSCLIQLNLGTKIADEISNGQFNKIISETKQGRRKPPLRGLTFLLECSCVWRGV